MTAKYQAGDLVQIVATGDVVTISAVTPTARQVYYMVFRDGRKYRYKESELIPFVDREAAIAGKMRDGSFANAESFQKYAYYRLFSESREGNLLSYQGNRIIFNPFQYKPLLKFLSIESDERLLIADEVGVGKTIEAGIILDELTSRGDLQPNDPILIVCPSILCEKWRNELRSKFLMGDFYIHDGKSLSLSLQDVIDSGRMSYPHAIASEQLIRGDRYRKLLRECLERRGEPFLGMLVIDECHHYRNPGTNTHKVGRLLSACSERVVMLSATPFNLRSDDLYNQLHMLDPALYQDPKEFAQLLDQVREVNQAIACVVRGDEDSRRELVGHLATLKHLPGPDTPLSGEVAHAQEMLESGTPLTPAERVSLQRSLDSLNPLATSFTRTLKRDALEHRVTRQAMTLEVHFTQREREVYDSFLSTNLQRYKMLGISERAFGLILNGLERIAASSLAALERNVRGFARMSDEEFAEMLSGGFEVSIPEARALRLLLQESYQELLGKIRMIGNEDSKYDTFKRLLEDIQESSTDNQRVIVFSFYTETLKYLRRRLAKDGYRVALMYGKTPDQTPKDQRDEDGFKILGRQDIMAAFEEGRYDILLLSEVGGEGLDFQFCSSLINYDLPYNPMRIEQRIGRIDRMGQEADKILIGSLCIEGTIDVVINRVLLSRISEATDLVGELEPIIAQELEELNGLMVTREFSEEELARREREIELRIEKERQTREEFDEVRYELVNDKGFRDEFEDSVRRSRISPRESLMLTLCFLKKESGCWCKPESETAATIHVTKGMCERIRDYDRRMALGKAGEELRAIVSADGELAIDFNGDEAYSGRSRVFFKPSGAWIHFLLDYIRALEPDGREDLFRASLRADALSWIAKGRYWLFVYEMEFDGFAKTTTYEYILTDLSGVKGFCLDDSQWKELLAGVTNSRSRQEDGLEQYDDARFCAEDLAESKKDELVADASGRNNIKILSRIRAIENLSTIRARELESELIGARGKEEERIRKALAREQSKASEKISILKEKMAYVGTYTLDAVCLLDVS